MNVDARASTDALVLNGMAIDEAIVPTVIHQCLGEPSRIHAAGPPAPHGHRSNQIHVYDALGLYFHEHHYTRCLTSVNFVFWPEAEGYPFTPEHAFAGTLRLGDYEVPKTPSEKQIIADCGLAFKEVLPGVWDLRGVISMGLYTKGAKLESGRRSATKRLVSVSMGWPHDPHSQPRTKT